MTIRRCTFYFPTIGNTNMATYGVDDRISGARFLVGAGNFSLRHSVQTDSGAHPASYPMGRECSLNGGKAAET
jgi:hypothetical protein